MVEAHIFHTLHNDICYEIGLRLATSNIHSYDPSVKIKKVNEREI